MLKKEDIQGLSHRLEELEMKFLSARMNARKLQTHMARLHTFIEEVRKNAKGVKYPVLKALGMTLESSAEKLLKEI